ncbi:MAG TPA: hypothetical protein VH475_20425 [Tepidisphaeraceae bacterium]|jgi:hypothetical protein
MSHPSVIRRLLSVAAFPLGLSAVAAIACYLAAGPTLGLMLGSLFMVTLLAPSLTLADEAMSDRLLVLVAIVLPVWVTWFVATLRSETHLSEWAACCLSIGAYAAALAGLASALRWCRLSAIVSAALTVIVGLAWLTWPIWLSRTFDGEASSGWVDKAAAVHPALSINIPNFSPWTEQTIAYHLTDLNQNVPYSPPKTVWAAVFLHGAIAAMLLVLVGWLPGRASLRASRDSRREAINVAAEAASPMESGSDGASPSR